MGVLVCAVVLLSLVFQSHSLGLKSPLSIFKRYQESVLSTPGECTRSRQPVIPPNAQNFSLDIRMPGVTPTASDSYMCIAVRVPRERDSYVVDFTPHASMETAHHMILFGCRSPFSTDDYWNCGGGTCKDKANIMYAWARNAPPKKLPRDVGFKVGGDSGINYFVLQIHYGDINAFRDNHRDCSGLTLTLTSKPQPLIAGVYLLMSMDTVIPPGKKVTNADIACTYKSYPMYPFAFRTHTHHLGKVVSGYRVRDGKWTLIGRQSPQLPQAFYPVNNPVDIRYGDKLAARCVFTGEGKSSTTYIGGNSDDEMCNFYIMYYMDAKQARPYIDCIESGKSELFKNIPKEANIPIPVSPSNMMMMHGHMNQRGSDEKSVLLQPKREEEEVLDQGYHLVEMVDWPEVQLQLGQVSGLALDSDDNLVIFHRGDHRWGVNSFDNQRIYQQQELGPIQQSTILVVDPVKGQVLKASGRNIFYLPHGISTDKNNNYWVTDVALHQVFKLGNGRDDEPLMVLGQAFQPGSDTRHFCQPTDVAVDPVSGNVYVSDGYCNSRIIKYSPEGKYLMHWGAGSQDKRKPVHFNIPHSLAFVPDRRELCVADRENGRIQCFLAESGEFVKEIKKDEFGGEVFAVSYAPENGGLIYAVNGESAFGKSAPVKGFVINYSTREILDTFSPETQEFKMPHDIVVSRDGTVFVGDATTDTVIKFVSSEQAEHRSVKKGGIEVHEIEDAESKLESSSSGGILGKLRGKTGGGLNLGNFFASHKGYSRKGFDRLSTEGSDQEKDDEDATDSETEEYSAPPPPPPPPPASSSS
ncbi:peptidyl-glycine alpha-amidating monooxygenase B isoform X6 [Amia ocellicauda]|uniref:peptidyl-glycine alpha-amidating monooxygenase B isoform X6 n=1 Tax=Amia ocellicauda TaxID=2972642 RepID=UPI0034645294